MVKNWLRLRQSSRKSGRFRSDHPVSHRNSCQSVYKPGSVPPDHSGLDGHSSGTTVSCRLKQPTRMTEAGAASGARKPLVTPIWSCSRWGFPCRARYRPRGALLPHLFTLTRDPKIAGGIAFCGTFPGVAPAGSYPAPCLRGARTFLAPLLKRGHPAVWHRQPRPMGLKIKFNRETSRSGHPLPPGSPRSQGREPRRPVPA